MATIRSFEDLDVWKKSRELSRIFYTYSTKNDLNKNFELFGQMKRSVGSIMDNIAEGFERDGRKEFIQFLSISKGSAGEFKSQLIRSYDWNYTTKEHFEDMLMLTEDILKSLKGFIEYLKQSDYKGTKFKDTYS